MNETISINKGNVLFARGTGWRSRRYVSYDQIRYNQENSTKDILSGQTVFGVVFFLLLMIALLVACFYEDAVVKNIVYDDKILAEYTEKRYEAEFSAYGNYENNILLVYLFDKDREQYKATVRVGKNIAPGIAELFQGDVSVYNEAIEDNLHEFFLGGYYGIEDDISEIVAIMYEKIETLGLNTNFISDTDADSGFVSHITDQKGLTYETENLNTVLEAFTSALGIPVVVVTDYLENVFEVKYSLTDEGILVVVFSAIFSIICIVMIVFYFVNLKKRAKKEKRDKENEIREKYGAPLGEGIE